MPYASVQGMSVNSIADLRHIKLDTVESYLADAMTAGKAYNWHRLNVPDSMLATVRKHASALLAAAAEGVRRDISLDGGSAQQRLEGSPVMPEGPCISGQNSHSRHECEYLDVCCAQQALDDQADEHKGVTGPKPQIHVPESGAHTPAASDISKGADTHKCHPQSSCAHSASTIATDSAAGAATKGAGEFGLGVEGSVYGVGAPGMPKISCTASAPIHLSSSSYLPPERPVVYDAESTDALCRGASAVLQAFSDHQAGAVRCRAVGQEANVDLLSMLQRLGVTIKKFKENLPEGIRFGQIRLCLAHNGRLSALSMPT